MVGWWRKKNRERCADPGPDRRRGPRDLPRVARRHKAARVGGPEDVVLEVGDIRIDIAHHTVTVDGAEVDLTPKEFAMLSLLARWPGRVVTHRMILHEVWGPDYVKETQYLRTY